MYQKHIQCNEWPPRFLGEKLVLKSHLQQVFMVGSMIINNYLPIIYNLYNSIFVEKYLIWRKRIERIVSTSAF